MEDAAKGGGLRRWPTGREGRSGSFGTERNERREETKRDREREKERERGKRKRIEKIKKYMGPTASSNLRGEMKPSHFQGVVGGIWKPT